jgi:RNA polymerase sigma-70 factor (ECF subfamily)
LPTDTTDAALVARVLAGDLGAFTPLVDRHYPSCARFARRMLGSADDAEDVLQETFLLAFRALGRYREQNRFRAWLFQILVNRCRTHARRRARQDRRFVHDDDAHAAAPAPHGGEPGLGDALQMALEILDAPHREALLLKYGEELAYPEMATMTGASVSALKMRVKRARDLVRPRLEELLHD